MMNHGGHGVSRRGLLILRVLCGCFVISLALGVAAQEIKPADEGGTVKGTVLGPGERPVAGARVVVKGNGVSLTTGTANDGTFEVKVPKVGSYSIRVDASGYRPGSGTARIDTPLQVAGPTIRIIPVQLAVRVYSAGGESSTPLSGVSIVLTPHDGAEPISGTTDGSGACYFSNLVVGTSYSIKATLIGYEPATQDTTIVSASETVTQNIVLSKGQSIPIARSKQRFGAPKLPSDDVRRVFQDGTGYIWFATDRGVARFDGANFETGGAGPLAGLSVRSVAEFDGGLWFGSDDGLWLLRGEIVAPISEFKGQAISAIAEEASGAGVWLATSSGLYRYAGGRFTSVAAGTFRNVVEDRTDGAIWAVGGPSGLVHVADGQIRDVPFAADGSLNNKREVTAVIRTRSGELLVGTSEGAFRIVDGAPTPFQPDEVRGEVIAFAEDARDNIWVATATGAVTYDALRGVSNVEFAGERINSLTNDREGNLWFATEKGAIRRDLYSFVPIRTSDGLINNNVTWIYPDRFEDGSPRLWFVTAATGALQQWTASTAFTPFEGLPAEARVNHVVRDRQGALWFATSRGVFRRESDTIEEISKAPALWLAEMSDGQIFVATESGVLAVNGRALEAVADLSRYTATRIFAIDDALWLATESGGVRYVPSSRTVEAIDVSRGVQGEAVRWVAADHAGHVWLATDFGVELLDAHSLKKVDNNAGVAAGDDARTLFLDADGFMWAGSAGLARKIAFVEGLVVETSYNVDQGVAGSINAIVQDTAGTIWLATDNGATQHLPTRTPPTLVPRVEVDGRAFAPGGIAPAGQHTIRFLFHGITTLGDVRYLYKLDTDDAWQLLPPRQELEREVSFPNLPAGTHTLELRVLNRDLYGIDAPPARIGLRIDVPIWQKWWFYGLGMLGVLGLAGGAGVAYRYRTREYVLPPELRNFVPIEPNPYIVGNPIRNEAMFFGREDDFRYVKTKLEGAAQGVVVVLCGDRRTGKSSILYQILNGRLGERFIPVFIDLQEMVVANDREFFRRMARLIGEACSIDKADVDAFGLGDEQGNPYHQFVDFLDAVLERIGDRALLLLVDEYELLESKVEEGRIDSEIFLFLAGLIDSKERLSFIFTGSRRLEERDRRYWREMLRRSLFRKIGFLSANDARRLITEPVVSRVVFGRNVVERIVRLTAGQPFYAQVICQTAVDYLNEHERNALAMADLDKVVAEIVDHPLPQMIYAWDALSADENVVLSLLAMQLDSIGEYGWASAADLVAFVEREKAPVDLSENTIHLTLEELFRTEVLEKSPFETYRFRIDLLRLWIRRSHSIWQVLKNP